MPDSVATNDLHIHFRMRNYYLLLAAALSGLSAFIQGDSFQPQGTGHSIQQGRVLMLPKLVAQAPTTVADVVAKAQAFKALLTTTQINTLQKTYTSTLAHNWSNLPCGSSCRNGLQFANLTTAQLTAALQVIQAAAGTTSNEGYDEFSQIRIADDVLKATAGGNAYSSTIYFISFLNEPTTTGTWMLQYGGHHYAANIAFNNGVLVGATPLFEGVEPTSFMVSGTAYAPIAQEQSAMTTMMASLSTSQLAIAKLNSTFSDVVLGPGQDGQFPSTKVGIKVSTLSTAQKALVLAAMKPWTQDVDDTAGATLLSVYESELDNTYIAYTGSGTSGNASTFLSTNINYVRIDGPSVWIEMVAQTGVVFPNQIHYHTIWRDHTRDYGVDLTLTALPLKLLNFVASAEDKGNVIRWQTSEETKVSHFEVQKTADPVKSEFTTIARVDATNTSEVQQYSVTDTDGAPITYYRLKMVDLDGSTTYSRLVGVKRTIRLAAVYPNPAKETISLNFSDAMVNATLTIINSGGRVVLEKRNVSGDALKVDVSGLVAGTYMIRLNDGSSTCTAKFIK